MSSVVSSTTRAIRQGGNTKKYRLINNAEMLLAESSKCLQAGDKVSAFDFAYQAALRLAGARVADSPIAKKARKPVGVWDQMVLVDDHAAQWAQFFSPYSRTLRRMINGLSHDMDVEAILAFQEKVWDFHEDLTGMAQGPAAA